MEVITYTVTPEEDGVCVRHILKAKLHFSTHAVARLTRAENGIRVNGVHARTVDPVHTGDVVAVRSDDLRPPKLLPTPGNWPLPIVYEDEHLLILNKPAGMTAHASNFLPDTPTVAGALAYQRGADFIFHVVNRLDKGTTGLMAVAKSGYIHDRLRRTLHGWLFPGIPGRVRRLPGAARRHHRRAHWPGRDFCRPPHGPLRRAAGRQPL